MLLYFFGFVLKRHIQEAHIMVQSIRWIKSCTYRIQEHQLMFTPEQEASCCLNDSLVPEWLLWVLLGISPEHSLQSTQVSGKKNKCSCGSVHCRERSDEYYYCEHLINQNPSQLEADGLHQQKTTAAENIHLRLQMCRLRADITSLNPSTDRPCVCVCQ